MSARLLTPIEVAEILGVAVDRARQLMREMRHTVVGLRTIRVTRAAVLHWMRRSGWEEQPTTLYFIEAVGLNLIKIGHTTDIRERLSRLQMGCPVELRILFVIPGTANDETRLHFRFHELHARGEWFRAESALLDYIEELRKGGPDGVPPS